MSPFTALAILSLLVMASLPLPSTEASATRTPHPRGGATAAEFLSGINAVRTEVGVPPLSWNATVAQSAKAKVNWLRSSAGCDLAQINRSPVPRVRGATFFRSPAGTRRMTPADAVWSWTDERRWYDHGSNTCAAGKQCGDYTLVVTRAWQQLGCAVVACPSGGQVMACEYSPGTNWKPDPKAPPY